jgi:hypothetical protein
MQLYCGKLSTTYRIEEIKDTVMCNFGKNRPNISAFGIYDGNQENLNGTDDVGLSIQNPSTCFCAHTKGEVSKVTITLAVARLRSIQVTRLPKDFPNDDKLMPVKRSPAFICQMGPPSRHIGRYETTLMLPMHLHMWESQQRRH